MSDDGAFRTSDSRVTEEESSSASDPSPSYRFGPLGTSKSSDTVSGMLRAGKDVRLLLLCLRNNGLSGPPDDVGVSGGAGELEGGAMGSVRESKWRATLPSKARV